MLPLMSHAPASWVVVDGRSGVLVRVLGVAWVVDGWANCCGFVADGVLLVDGGLNADA